MKKIFVLFFLFAFQLWADEIYFPPIDGKSWETISLETLGWNVTKVNNLYDFLEANNTKAFIVLKNGKIVLEKYFGTFTQDSLWYWASAGKTITAFLVGKAQEEGYLNINDRTSKYLGEGWTKCTKEQEDKITIRHQLTMTTGLDDGVPDNHCTIDTCLVYKADAGTRWAYHNAPYTLLEKVLSTATKLPINVYTQQKLGSKTGINGFFYTIGYDNVFFSKARSMARFGLLFLNDCIWDKDTLLKDRNYFIEMVNTSQPLNKSYGYLWWLNGKSSFMVPSLQIVFPGPLFPDAPMDVIAGLGKNGQIVCVSKSLGLVVVRMGEKPDDDGEVSINLCNQIWEKLNDIMGNANSISEYEQKRVTVFPNPATNKLFLSGRADNSYEYEISNIFGQVVQKGTIDNGTIDIANLPRGLYFLKIGNSFQKFIVLDRTQ
jgi:CubicO group peptidase (beta-lactamase class C family)